MAIVLLMAAGCKTTKLNENQVVAAMPAFDYEAHRGGRGLMPENTISAMLNAIDLGVTTLEMDSHITADGRVIIAHDDYINPMFSLDEDGGEIKPGDAKRYVLYQMPYLRIRKFDVGIKPYSNFPLQSKKHANIPLLENLIDSVQNYLKTNHKNQVFYNIEIKSSKKGDNYLHPEPEKFVKLLMDVVEKKGIKAWVVVQSFDPRPLEILHRDYPKVRTSFLVDSGDLQENLKRLTFTPFIYSPHEKLVNPDMIRNCHAAGIKVIPWTVNSKAAIQKLKDMGIDGVISDYPDYFK